MSIARTTEELRHQGIELWFEADTLRFRAPKGALSPEHRAWLSENREAVLEALKEKARCSRQSHPVSFEQKALWFIQQQAPESSAYHVSVPARINGPVVPSALRKAVQALVDRHPSLRTTYAIENGELLQVVAGWDAASFDARPMGSLVEPALRQLVEDDAAAPFDLATGPLLQSQALHAIGRRPRAVDDGPSHRGRRVVVAYTLRRTHPALPGVCRGASSKVGHAQVRLRRVHEMAAGPPRWAGG